MAHYVGIDLGAHSVKVVVIEVRFRETKLKGAYEQRIVAGDAVGASALPGSLGDGGESAEITLTTSPGSSVETERRAAFESSLEATRPVPPPIPGAPRPPAPPASTAGAPAGEACPTHTEQLDRAARALDKILRTYGIRVEGNGIASLPGDHVTVRELALPFGDLRKVARVIAFELESQIPFEMEEVVYDYAVVERTPQKTRLLAAASPNAEVSHTLASLASVQVHPRVIAPAPLAFAPMLQKLLPETPQPVAVIDLGHSRTTVCVVHRGKPQHARCINRGGQDVTRAIGRAFRLASQEAERYKHAYGVVGGGSTLPQPPGSAGTPDIGQVCRQALTPLVRELRQTLAACRAAGTEVGRLLVTGGAAQLRGLLPYLAAELELPVDQLVCDLPGMKAVSKSPTHMLALSLALGGAAGRGQLVDLRKGEFAYRGDTSALRTRLPQLGAWAAVLVACLGLNAIASYRSLSREAKELDARLERETRALFGSPRSDAARIAKELRAKGKDQNPVPDTTAYDVLSQLSKALPDKDSIKLDVVELDIKPRKTFLRATAESHGQVDDVVKALKTIACFEEVKQGRTQDVGKAKEFTVDIKTRCP